MDTIASLVVINSIACISTFAAIISSHRRPPSEHSGPPSEHSGPPSEHPSPPSEHPSPPSQHSGPPSEHPSPPSEHPSPPREHPSPPREHPSPPSEHPSPPSEHPSPPSEHPSPPSQHSSPLSGPPILVGVLYTKGLRCTDSQYIYENSTNSIIVYNENEKQYLDKTDLSPGGGNGKMRVYRIDRTEWLGARVIGSSCGCLGVPTDAANMNTIDQSIENIGLTLDLNPHITHVFYALHETKKSLGLGIFASLKGAPENAAHAYEKLVSLRPWAKHIELKSSTDWNGLKFSVAGTLFVPKDLH